MPYGKAYDGGRAPRQEPAGRRLYRGGDPPLSGSAAAGAAPFPFPSAKRAPRRASRGPVAHRLPRLSHVPYETEIIKEVFL